MTVITRFPPSPTGPLHVGNVRTALFNYFFARQNKGKFIVRVEDTDKARSKKEYEDGMLSGLAWLGINRDNEEIIHQSERTDVYKKYLHKLIDSGKAYISQETEGENKEVVRFKNPKTTITFDDLVRGQVSIDTTDLGDFIIARNINDPVYHMSVVVDDFEQGVTHVIRGEDHISNTPRHILLQEAIGAPRPVYAHLPLILATDRAKLSKRKHGQMVSLDYYKSQGYLPEAILNFLSMLGFNPTGEQEIYSLDDLIKIFDFSKVQKGGAIFNVEKLDWFNRQYITKLSDDSFTSYAAPFLPNWLSTSSPIYARVLSIVKEKIVKFSDITTMFMQHGELEFIQATPEYPVELLLWKKNPSKEAALNHLNNAFSLIKDIPENLFIADSIKTSLWSYAETHGKGDVLWPLRVALTGKEKSPDPFISAFILGREESLKRITDAQMKLS